MLKVHRTFTGKQWKKFISGVDYMENDSKYRLTIEAKNIFDWVRFHWDIMRRHKATFTVLKEDEG